MTLCALTIGLSCLASGCSRDRNWFRQQADDQTFSILDEKTAEGSWPTPDNFSIQPSSDSRLFDPSPTERPMLPDPVPKLHSYEIPPGIGRRTRETVEQEAQARRQGTKTILKRAHAHRVQTHRGWRASEDGNGDIVTAAPFPTASQVKAASPVSPTRAILLTRFLTQNENGNLAPGEEVPFEIDPVTVPPSAWQSVPVECRVRMFEFESVRSEYETSHSQSPPQSERDNSPRLNFDDIVELALLNSREYQTEKERLYRAALRLTLERFQYDLKFSPFGNGTGADATIVGSSAGGSGVIGFPTQARADALLNTGSTFVTRLANDVVLTFGGAEGFAADIGSELLFELTHSVFQNDIRFERLTQAERSVIYSAQGFMRFRRTFYLQLASQYYNLLQTYRQVEINSQNYFSLIQVYSQRAIELAEGTTSHVQIDQVEQSALRGRSDLIGVCNSLENALDSLKIRIGLPTETAINIDLTELEELTLQDEVLVTLELIGRIRRRVEAELNRDEVDAARLLNNATELVARMRESLATQLRLVQADERTYRSEADRKTDTGSNDQEDAPPRLTPPDEENFEQEDLRLAIIQSQLRVAELRELASRVRVRLLDDRDDPDVSRVRVSDLSIEFAQAVLNLLVEELVWAELLGADEDAERRVELAQEELTELYRESAKLSDVVLADQRLIRLNELLAQAQKLVISAESAATLASRLTDGLATQLGLKPGQTPAQLVVRPLAESQQILDDRDAVLAAVRVGLDDASLAALLTRLDLMTARGQLADQRRGIKLAADDLKSVLNLAARQRLTTENDINKTEFDFDQSTTELAVTLDTPLNRRAQRNTFREQLLNYQVARRALMGLEDGIKQQIRSDLRTLRLAEEQHALGIASSALASERAIGTELQLRLGVPGVTARDYLEAQRAYADSLSTVASRHIGHILGRIRLFVNLEQVQLNSQGRWPGLVDTELQPDLNPSAGPGLDYGRLPPKLQYSDEMRQGLRY